MQPPPQPWQACDLGCRLLNRVEGAAAGSWPGPPATLDCRGASAVNPPAVETARGTRGYRSAITTIVAMRCGLLLSQCHLDMPSAC